MVILFDNSYPLANPSSNESFKLKEPLADPIVVSFCFDWLGIKAFILSSYFNLFPDCEERWTVGVQFPDTHIQSQRKVSKKVLKPLKDLWDWFCKILWKT